MENKNAQPTKIPLSQKIKLTRNEIKQVYWGEDEEIRRDIVVIVIVSILGSIMMLAAGSISKTIIEFIVNLGKTQ